MSDSLEIFKSFAFLATFSFFTSQLFFHRDFLRRFRTLSTICLLIPFGYMILLIQSYLLVERTNGGVGQWKSLLICSPIIGGILFVVRNSRREIIQYVSNFLLVMIAIPTFVWVPLWILISNNWYFAEGVGDDGARWFMMEDYLKSNSFNIWHPVETTLRFTFDGRGLSLVSNAMVGTLFNLEPGVPTTTAYLFAVACAGLLTFAFLFNSLSKEISRKVFQNISLISFGLIFGLIGSIPNLFFSGRLTQVFSIFPLFGLIFTSTFFEKFKLRLFNYTFWTIALSLSYSARYILLASAIITLLEVRLQLTKEESQKKTQVAKRVLISASIPTAISLVISFSEIKNISNLLLSDRGSDYGLFGKSILQNILVWTGFLSTWTQLSAIESIMGLSLIATLILLIFIVFIRLFVLSKKLRKDFSTIHSITASLVFVLILLGFFHSFFLIYKLSTYVPYLVLVSTILILFEIGKSEIRRLFRLVLVSSAALTYLGSYILFAPIQISLYEDLIKARYSSVNRELLGARNVIETQGLRGTVYGYISDPESHLLSRAVFSKYLWEPLNSDGYDFSGEIVPKPNMDSEYDWLLVRKRIECQLIDFYSNDFLYSSKDTHLFGRDSSLIEFGSGMKVSYMDARSSSNCLSNRFEYRALMKQGIFKFINGANSKFLYLYFKVQEGQNCGQIHVIEGSSSWSSKKTELEDVCLVSLSGKQFEDNRILIFEIENKSNQELALIKIRWEK